MAEVSRITALWSGFAGAPGYSKFSFMPLADDTARNAAGAAIRAFFEAIKMYLPPGTSIAVQPQVDNLDLVTGQLMASANMTTTPTNVTGTGIASAWAGGSGVVVSWLAGGVFAGRRIKGRTFIVPAVDLWSSDGTPSPASITAIQAAGTALIGTAGADFAIWNRSYNDATPPVPTAGNLSSATSCVMRDVASQLRSRRS